MKLTYNQTMVFNYLSGKYPEYIGPTQIGQEVAYSDTASPWASRICKALVKKGLVERNQRGQYRTTSKSMFKETQNDTSN